MRQGLDYAWHGKLEPERMLAAGYTFACRYLSRDPIKDINRAEAELLSSHGIDIVLVWETSEKRPITGGYDGGKVDARTAFARAAELGMPDHRPVYFAVDWDVASAAADPYFRGIRDAGYPAERVGVYAGIRPLAHLLDVGLAKWGWQTSAWSGGKWDPRAHLQQYRYDIKMHGTTCDANRAPFEDFGQWSLREEDDMYTDKDRERDAYTAVRALATSFDVKILEARLLERPDWVDYYQRLKIRDVRNERIELGIAKGEQDETSIPKPEKSL